jgi:hypothetical protein
VLILLHRNDPWYAIKRNRLQSEVWINVSYLYSS